MNMSKLDRFNQLSSQDLEKVEGGTILGFIGGYIVGAGGMAWAKMHKNNPGMASSAING